MHIYAIYNTKERVFLRYGRNGGGAVGYCLYRGQMCVFATRLMARAVIGSFDRPEGYEVREFTQTERRNP